MGPPARRRPAVERPRRPPRPALRAARRDDEPGPPAVPPLTPPSGALHATAWEAWGRAPEPPADAGAELAPRVVPPLPRTAHAAERAPAPLPHGAGRALFPWREHRLVGREEETERPWALALAATTRRRVLVVEGVPGSGRRRLLRWLRERLAEWGRPARLAGPDPLADAEALGREPGPGPRLLVVETAEGARAIVEAVPADAPVLLAFVAEPGQTPVPGGEVVRVTALPEARWSELVDALLPLGPALQAAVLRAAAGLPGRAVSLVGALVGRGLLPGPAGFELPEGEPVGGIDLGLPERAERAAARCRTPGERLALGVHAALGADAEPVLDDAVARACATAGTEPPHGRPWLRSLVDLGLATPGTDGARLLPEAAAALLDLPDLERRPLHEAARAAWEGCADPARRSRGIGEQLLALGEVEAALKPLETSATWFMGADRHREALAGMATWERAMASAPPAHPRWLHGWSRLSYAAWQSGDLAAGERYGRLAHVEHVVDQLEPGAEAHHHLLEDRGEVGSVDRAGEAHQRHRHGQELLAHPRLPFRRRAARRSSCTRT